MCPAWFIFYLFMSTPNNKQNMQNDDTATPGVADDGNTAATPGNIPESDVDDAFNDEPPLQRQDSCDLGGECESCQ